MQWQSIINAVSQERSTQNKCLFFVYAPLFIHFFFFHFFFLSFFPLLIIQGLIAVLFLSVHQLRSRLVRIHNTLSARPCKERSEAEKRKFSKEMEVRDPLMGRN